MRVAASLALFAILAGCMDNVGGNGCTPFGGDVVWHQPGVFAAARVLPDAKVTHPEPNPYPLTAGHPLRERFGDDATLLQVAWDEADGGASVPFDVDPTVVHAGGKVADLRRGAVNLVRHLAADPSDADVWAQRHDIDALNTMSQPTPLDIRLRVLTAAAEADGPPSLVQHAHVEVRDGKATWSVGVAQVQFAAGNRLVEVLGGDWVRAEIVDNPADLHEAERWGVDAARAAGLPDGPRDSVDLQESLLCE